MCHLFREGWQLEKNRETWDGIRDKHRRVKRAAGQPPGTR